METTDVLFTLFVTLIIYTYLIYPLIIYIWGRFVKQKETIKKIEKYPSVTLLIPGHNIHHLVKTKVENIMKQEYEGHLKFLFVLDGCTDSTEELLTELKNKNNPFLLDIVSTKERNGKEAAIRVALEKVDTKVIVFSDSDAMLNPDCVQKLIEKLMQEGVGAVSGREIHRKSSEQGASEGQGLFYKYEEFIKKYLNNVGSLPYVQGGNFAMFKELYPEDIPLGCTQDGVIAFNVVSKGYRVSYEPKAISSEEYNLSNKEDFSRRVRTITRAFYSIICKPQVFNPLKTGSYFLHVLSGRIFRWFALFFALFTLFFGLCSESENIYYFTLGGFITWISLALVGYLTERKGKRIKLPYFVYYFSYIHLAAAIAVVKVCLGKRTSVWKPSN
jgi:cellulose synthase/poly-beta-1,6-N-acetylglucosamine synthase-like glycosyltransferase